MQDYFSGKILYGDDFGPSDLAEWFKDEREACADLGYKDRPVDFYVYHQLNMQHGFKLLPDRQFNHLLGLGSAFGPELSPILDRSNQVTVVEASEQLTNTTIAGKSIAYILAQSTGELSFPDSEADVAVCFGVLHHIANVSFVLSEVARCLAPDGYFIVREPIVSMCDWRLPRAGHSKHERGIPIPLFRRMLDEAGFEIEHEHPCIFPLTILIGLELGLCPLNSRLGVWLDGMLCRLFGFNRAYHAESFFRKFRPTSCIWVCRKKH